MDFSEGTPTGAGQGPSGKGKVIAIVAAAVAVVAIGVAAFFLLQPKRKVEVPNVRYWYQEQAEPMISEAGLVLGEVTEESNDESFEGLVIRQSPDAGAVVDEGTPVNITIAKGLKFPSSLKVPDLKGMDTEEAEIALMTAFIIGVPGEPQYSEDVEPGKVCAQSEGAGSEIPVTAEQIKTGELPTVTYYVSLGREKTKVPDVVGKTRDEAEAAVEKASLSFDTTSSYSDSVPDGKVISQNVAVGTELDKGSLVTVDISMGPQPVERVEVPNVATYNLEDARRTMESAGLRFDYEGDAKGFVVAVNPKVGTTVDKGSAVKVTLRVPEPVVQKVQVPDVRGDDLTVEAVRAIVDSNNLGTFESAERVVGDDKVEYWMVTTRNSDGGIGAYFVDPDGNWR